MINELKFVNNLIESVQYFRQEGIIMRECKSPFIRKEKQNKDKNCSTEKMLERAGVLYE